MANWHSFHSWLNRLLREYELFCALRSSKRKNANGYYCPDSRWSFLFCGKHSLEMLHSIKRKKESNSLYLLDSACLFNIFPGFPTLCSWYGNWYVGCRVSTIASIDCWFKIRLWRRNIVGSWPFIFIWWNLCTSTDQVHTQAPDIK